MTNELVFKQIDPKDFGETLFKMDIEAFNRKFDYPSPSVKMTLDYLKNCQVYLAYDDSTLIGTFAFETKKESVEVKQIIVLPKFQKKGYGNKLVKELLRINNGKQLWLVTHPKNTGAIVLYLKNRFEIVAWKDDYYGDKQPRIILRHSNP